MFGGQEPANVLRSDTLERRLFLDRKIGATDGRLGPLPAGEPDTVVRPRAHCARPALGDPGGINRGRSL